MTYSTTLEQLPQDLTIPDHLRERFYYTAEKRRLNFCGFMTKCDYDQVIGLHPDSQYRQAVERLFVLTSAELRPVAARRFYQTG